jgi:hypothetical protein
MFEAYQWLRRMDQTLHSERKKEELAHLPMVERSYSPEKDITDHQVRFLIYALQRVLIR